MSPEGERQSLLPVRFTRVELTNWRNFKRVDVPLARRVFLVGPNAAGKSNFLDVFRFLRDIVSMGGGFQEAVHDRGDVSKLRCLAGRDPSHVMIKVTFSDADDKCTWQYALRFNQDRKKQHVVIKEERVLRGTEKLVMRPDDDDLQDSDRLTQTHLEQVNANKRFREVVDFFRSIRYLHIVPQFIKDPNRPAGRKQDPYGTDFLEQIAQTAEKTRVKRLNKINEALKVAVPQLKELKLEPDERGVPHLRGLYEHWRLDAGWQTEDQFSDGTLRLMGFLWALLDEGGPLLLEEPELSLHPEVVRHIPQMITRVKRRKGRQVILSTHSRDLLEAEGIGLDETLLLMPGKEGTKVEPASADDQARALLEGGATMADAVLPRTRPENVQQLSLFEE